MLTWFLVGLLGMIWAAFLLPSRKRSPTSSVEEFERRMSLLAEANNDGAGRWVLMPRKGQRFVGSRDRERVRARRRRRQVFMVLLELTALTLLMGVFPPFRSMLYATGILAFLLLAYSALLVKIRETELATAGTRAAIRREQDAYLPSHARRPVRVGAYAYAMAGGNGHGNGNGNGNGHGYGYPSAHANGYDYTNGNGNGHAARNGGASLAGNGHGSSDGGSRRAPLSVATRGNGSLRSNGNGHANGRVVGAEPPSDVLRESGVQIIDDDVHVVVRRVGEFDPTAARPATP